MGFLTDLLLKSVKKISEINKKITQIDDNATCIINIKEKDKSKCVNQNMLTKVYIEEEKELIDNNNNWAQKILLRSFGTIILYLKYVKRGYSVVITMYT